MRFSVATRAINAAKNLSTLFHAMSDDPAMAVWTDRRQRVNRAFEAVEGMMLAGDDHFECLVVFVFANFACRHT